jgi:hypothetical protein
MSHTLHIIVYINTYYKIMASDHSTKVNQENEPVTFRQEEIFLL